MLLVFSFLFYLLINNEGKSFLKMLPGIHQCGMQGPASSAEYMGWVVTIGGNLQTPHLYSCSLDGCLATAEQVEG